MDYFDSAYKYLSDAWNGVDPSEQKPVVQIPSPENKAAPKPNEPWYSDYLPSTAEVVQFASDAGTALQNKAKYYDEKYLAPAQEWVSETSDEAIAYYEKTKAEAYDAASSALASAEKLYEENKEVVIATAVAGPLGGLAVYGAKQLLEDEPIEETTQPEEMAPPPSAPEATDPKELLLSESTDTVEETPETTHARTITSNDTTEETSYRSEPTDTESAPTTTAKTTVVSTAPQQPKTTQTVTTPTTEIVEPVVIAKASTEATTQATRTTAPEPAKTETVTNEVASSSQPATATVTSTPVTATTETQQTDNKDSGSSDSGNGETTYAFLSSGEGSNVSANSLAGIVSDPLGRTGQNSGTASQSAGNNTTTNSELAANAASNRSNKSDVSNWSNGTNNDSTAVNTGTQASYHAVASTQPQQSADQRQQPLGVKLPGQDTQNNNDGDTATAPTSSSSAALASAIAHAGVQQGLKIDSSSKGTHQDSKSSGEVAQADSEKINGTGNPLENSSGDNGGNPFGNQAETIAALTDLENHFLGENEDYPVGQIATNTIFTSASQISTFG